MNPNRFLFILLTCVVACALLVAGCAVPPATPEPSSASAESAAATETIIISHALGETEITGTPVRVVTLEWSYTEDVLALGVQPVGVADIEGYESWVDIPVTLDEAVVDVGTRQEPNLELLAELRPDLIIAPAFRIAETYEQLSEIAPVLAFDAYPADENITQFAAVKEAFLTIASVLGREAEGEAVLADMEAHFAAAQEQIEAAGLLGEPFVLAQAFGEDTVSIRLFTDNAMAVEIVEQIGLENAWADAEFQLYGFTTVSVETLPDLGTVNFFYVVQDDNQVFQRAAIQPLWESLDFVQAGKAYPLGGDTWFFGGPLSAKVLVDLIVEALTGEPVGAEGSVRVISQTDTQRVIQHADGREATIPADPQCIVTAGSGYLDHLLALGVAPCGAAHGPGGSGFPEHLADQLTDVEYVGGTLEVNLESVAFLDPDLILGMHPEHTEGNAATNFDPVAPTIYLTEPWADWRQTLREIGLILGKADEAEAVLAEFDETIADAAAELAESVGDEKVAFLRVQQERLRVYGTNSPTGDLLFNRLGLTPSALVPVDEEQQTISLELIPDLDAEHLFLLDQTEDGMATLTGSPLWQTVPAVESGNVYPVDVKIWIQGEGLFAYEQLVADVVEALAR